MPAAVDRVGHTPGTSSTCTWCFLRSALQHRGCTASRLQELQVLPAALVEGEVAPLRRPTGSGRLTSMHLAPACVLPVLSALSQVCDMMSRQKTALVWSLAPPGFVCQAPEFSEQSIGCACRVSSPPSSSDNEARDGSSVAAVRRGSRGDKVQARGLKKHAVPTASFAGCCALLLVTSCPSAAGGLRLKPPAAEGSGHSSQHWAQRGMPALDLSEPLVTLLVSEVRAGVVLPQQGCAAAGEAAGGSWGARGVPHPGA